MLLESIESKAVAINKRQAEIVILEEGPGNKGRKCWYGPEALESGREIFRGVQVYADHPGNAEQSDLPERSVRDIVGRIKETWLAKNPETGKQQLRGNLKICEGRDFDWVVSLIKESLQADTEGFSPVAQVSIHADGDIAPKVIGGEKYNYVSRIKSAVSVDIVTKGGIRNSGFVKFMENALGGLSMSAQNETRFRQIQQKLAESLSTEDAKFLESYLQEGAEGDEGQEDEELMEDGADEGENIFEDEEGNLYAATGEIDAAGNPIMITEDGEAIVMDASEFSDEDDSDFAEEEIGDEDYDDEEEEEDFDDGAQYADADDDEVPLGEMADRFPALAREIDHEERHAMESDRDYDVATLKMENKLLKSRMIADSKLQESGLPTGLIPLTELVGKSPTEMDAIIDGRCRMFEAFSGMVKGATASLVEASAVRDVRDTAIGLRLLRSSLLPG